MYDPNATLPAFHLAYHIPPSRTPDHYALEMLALILGDGDRAASTSFSSNATKSARRSRSPPTIDGVPDLFSVWAVMASGRSAEQGAAGHLFRARRDRIKQGVTRARAAGKRRTG